MSPPGIKECLSFSLVFPTSLSLSQTGVASGFFFPRANSVKAHMICPSPYPSHIEWDRAIPKMKPPHSKLVTCHHDWYFTEGVFFVLFFFRRKWTRRQVLGDLGRPDRFYFILFYFSSHCRYSLFINMVKSKGFKLQIHSSYEKIT